MKYRFEDSTLQKMYEDERYVCRRFDHAIHNSFRKVMRIIELAGDIRDLHSMRSLNFEKLHGNRRGQMSLRLNKQFRLIVRIEQAADGQTIVVIEIVDYH